MTERATDEKLAECPFNDRSREHKARVRDNSLGDLGPPNVWWVGCSCGAEGPNGSHPDEARAAWNRRAPIAEIERLREALRKIEGGWVGDDSTPDDEFAALLQAAARAALSDPKP